MARDPKRIQRMTQRLAVLWHEMPDLRLGQLFAYVQNNMPVSVEDMDPFYIEDNEWEQAIEQAITAQAEVRFKTPLPK